MACTHDIGELRQLRSGGIRIQVCGSVAQVNHDPGEFLNVLSGNTQLSACSHDGVNLIRGSGNLGGHSLGCFCQFVKVLFCAVDRFADIRKGGFKVHTGFDRCRSQRHNRGGDVRCKRLPGLGHGLGQGSTLL